MVPNAQVPDILVDPAGLAGRLCRCAGAGQVVTGLIGIGAATFVLVAIGSALVVTLRRPWTRIAVRVAGSWIAAIGLLLLGWALRGQV